MRQLNSNLDPASALNHWSNAPAAITDTDLCTHYTCKLVTPLYGGGVRAGVIDSAMPIRAAGIRGQLRFWWRIANGPFASSTDMFQRETAIWGGIGNKNPIASKVAVRIKTKPVQAAQLIAKSRVTDLPTYALIIEPSTDPLLLKDYQFQLTVQLHPELTAAQRDEVTEALHWWASFGGVGARTRRGLGALQINNLSAVTAAEVAQRGGRLCVRPAEKTAELAWKNSVNRLAQFRQGVDLGRNPRSPGSESPAGRSRWPEPDMIRSQTRRHAPAHKPTHPVTTVYPRAAFGLPIVFHFKDENKGEPAQQLLVPEIGERTLGDRMASQLILRPYSDGKTWRPAALLMPGWQAALAVSAGFAGGKICRAWPTDSVERQQLAAQIKPMDGRGDDPLTAFLHYFEER